MTFAVIDKPTHPCARKPLKAGVYERTLIPGMEWRLSRWDGTTWFLGADTAKAAQKEPVPSPLQSAGEWREA